MKSVVVFSGGMDSTTALYKLISEGDEVSALTFDYGSKHNASEYNKAVQLCSKLNIVLTKIELPLDRYFKSSLLQSGEEIPEGHYQEETMKSTVVPFRNGIMLSIAIGFAESMDADRVVIGNHSGDHAIYPDCRSSFINAMNDASKFGTYNEIGIYSPFCQMSKREIALEGEKLNINWNDTWSCYKGGEIHCGKCGTCVERKEALKGIDPTQYLD
ncbi:MAG: 7-cyano-7-deazaguanine synthase QueC [Bacteriovoracaceae bacterium]|nr:7-cyano-7-deazaguanine synthase QueC [Bacteriovoracaceae bacterium]